MTLRRPKPLWSPRTGGTWTRQRKNTFGSLHQVLYIKIITNGALGSRGATRGGLWPNSRLGTSQLLCSRCICAVCVRLMPLGLVTFELTDGTQKIRFFTISRRSPLTLDPDSAAHFLHSQYYSIQEMHTKLSHRRL